MGNRLFISSVLLLWLGSMAWLVVNKILPSFTDGKPPIASGLEVGKVVAWRVHWGGRPVGWAASLRVNGALNTTELHNRVVLRDVPLLDLAPVWMRSVVDGFGNMKFDAQTLVEFDSLDHFSSFNSRVAVNDIPSVLRISGRMKDSKLELRLWSGASDLTYTKQVYIPQQTALNEALFPDAKMPYMYVGRRWQEEVFSPFKTPSSPVELMEAEVVAKETMEYGGEGERRRVLRVEYRRLPGPGIHEDARLQAICWVDLGSGFVLRQDVFLANSKLRFERLPEEAAYRTGLELFPHEEVRKVESDTKSDTESAEKKASSNRPPNGRCPTTPISSCGNLNASVEALLHQAWSY